MQDLVREIAAGSALKASEHRIFKLEDVAVGSWVDFVARDRNWEIHYIVEAGFNYNGCSARDVVSHYIKPKQQLCMYENNGACCVGKARRGQHLRGGDN